MSLPAFTRYIYCALLKQKACTTVNLTNKAQWNTHTVSDSPCLTRQLMFCRSAAGYPTTSTESSKQPAQEKKSQSPPGSRLSTCAGVDVGELPEPSLPRPPAALRHGQEDGYGHMGGSVPRGKPTSFRCSAVPIESRSTAEVSPDLQPMLWHAWKIIMGLKVKSAKLHPVGFKNTSHHHRQAWEELPNDEKQMQLREGLT